jgi:hypothetical protein
MFVLFSPFTFLFFLIYLTVLIILPSISDFYTFWLFIEVMTLVLMGISYTVFTNSLSQLMVYFFVQSLSSFFILISFVLSSPLFFTLSVVLKMGIAPFFMWYQYSVIRFPNLMFYVVSTFHKFPVLFIILQFNLALDMAFFWVSALLTIVVAGSIIISSQDLRYLLVSSSVGNNSWFLLACLSGLHRLRVFLFRYSLLFLGLVFSLNSTYRIRPSYAPRRVYSLVRFLCLLSSLPPSPLFFVKLAVMFNLFYLGISPYLLVLFLVFSSSMVCGYVVFCMTFLTLHFSHPRNLF